MMGARMTRWLRLSIALMALGLGFDSLRAAEDFLEPEKAFRFSARALDARHVEVVFSIAPGYYMYREQFRFVASGTMFGAPEMPSGKVKYDETFRKDVETYRERVNIRVPVDHAPAVFRLDVSSQGCADKGLCYPPMQSSAEVALTGFGGTGDVRVLAVSQSPTTASDAPRMPAINTASPTDGERLDAALRSGRWWSVIGIFFVAGVLLSLTPCVLPMLPIVSSIIVGHGVKVSRQRGLALAGSYALGMAVVYTALGIAAGLAGEGLAAALQNPWVLGVFALVLVALALSMFGLYELRLPSVMTTRLSNASRRLPAGRIGGVFAMGGISALIVSPCVAAPLAGALVYLSQTRDVAVGGLALFALAAGMSVPLLLIGASAGALLPRAAAWMLVVKRCFGIALLGVALWTLQPLLPASLSLAMWGALAIGAALALHVFERISLRGGIGPWALKLSAASVGIFGLLQMLGAATGGADPLLPLSHLVARDARGASALSFTTVRNVAELDAALHAANRPAMLDFYADWCVSCKEMERFTFAAEAVRQRLAGVLLLKADVTSNGPEDRELLRRFRMFGPPGTLFFDAQGREIVGSRVIGFQGPERFMQSLQSAGL